MNVNRIYSRQVVSVPRSTSLRQAARIMSERHVGSLLVTDDAPRERQALGIVTDRDFVLHGVAEGADPNAATVDTVMTGALARVPDTADAHEALAAMSELGVRRLVVTHDDGGIVGLLSFDDIVDALAVEMSELARVVQQGRARETATTAPAEDAEAPLVYPDL